MCGRRQKFDLKAGQRCRGAAVVELAIFPPLLFVLLFGSIEVNNRIFLRQTLLEGTYESALLGPQTSRSA